MEKSGKQSGRIGEACHRPGSNANKGQRNAWKSQPSTAVISLHNPCSDLLLLDDGEHRHLLLRSSPAHQILHPFRCSSHASISQFRGRKKNAIAGDRRRRRRRRNWIEASEGISSFSLIFPHFSPLPADCFGFFFPNSLVLRCRDACSRPSLAPLLPHPMSQTIACAAPRPAGYL